MTRLSIITGLLLASFALAGPAAAKETPAGASEATISDAEAAKAEAFIRIKHNKVRKVLRKPDTPARGDELT
ncbi:MAG: hypothetical protein KJN97_02020, partial [Deltaproteobacteria bacterium]|nr:hypothetical protein [Deltaproteobacteria bacterium]